jgi:protein-S-isoprenylcysteine O-methyltransferase Ste14
MDKTAIENRNLPDGGVIALVRPPIVYVIAIVAGLGLEAGWPTPPLPNALALLGIVLVLIAGTLFALSIRELRAARTTFRTQQPTTTIVRTGPYRLSRNPIYLAFILLQLGIGLWWNSAWVLGLLVPAFLLVSFGTIAREERYLEEKFGDEYRRYRAAVRRWLQRRCRRRSLPTSGG